MSFFKAFLIRSWRIPVYDTTPMAVKMPTIATTVTISIRVKPLLAEARLILFLFIHYFISIFVKPNDTNYSTSSYRYIVQHLYGRIKYMNKENNNQKDESALPRKGSEAKVTGPTAKSQAKDLDGVKPEIYKKRWWILVSLCIALLAVMLANSSLNMALPAMSKDLGLSQLDLTWVVNIYTLIFASLLFIAGAIGDRYGRKKVMQGGLVVFFLGSLFAAFIAADGSALINARIAMGIGAAFVMPTTLSIINTSFPRKERAKAIAIWGAVSGVGMMLGSIVSGILLEHFTWHSLFIFSAIVAILGFTANQINTPESYDEAKTPVDWIGGVLSAIGLFTIVYGITEAPSTGWLSLPVLLNIGIGLFAMFLFVVVEKRKKFPLLDVALFKHRSFSISTLILVLTFLAMSGVMFAMSQLMQLVIGFTPLQASLATIPIMLPMAFFGPVVPLIVRKFGARPTITTGLVLVTIAFLFMAGWDKDISYIQLLLVGGLMMLGISTSMTPTTNILMASVPRNRSGMGSAMNDATRQLGSALGVAILGATLSAVYTNEISKTVTGLNDKMQQGVESSLAVALEISKNIGPIAQTVSDAAKTAWMTGMNEASLLGAVILAIAAGIAFFGLPRRVKGDKDA